MATTKAKQGPHLQSKAAEVVLRIVLFWCYFSSVRSTSKRFSFRDPQSWPVGLGVCHESKRSTPSKCAVWVGDEATVFYVRERCAQNHQRRSSSFHEQKHCRSHVPAHMDIRLSQMFQLPSYKCGKMKYSTLGGTVSCCNHGTPQRDARAYSSNAYAYTLLCTLRDCAVLLTFGMPHETNDTVDGLPHTG